MNKRWLGLWFALISLAFSIAVYGRLPERIATHYNVHGVADGWSSRPFGAFMMPLFAVLMTGLMNLFPRIMPRGQNFERFEDTYWVITNLIVGFICAMNVMMLGRAMGWPISMPTAVLLGIGILFMVIGNLLPRTRSNWFLGIRTPWTLESDNVWRQTHRLGGRTFVFGGLITVIAAFLPAKMQPVVAITALVIAGFVPVIYSYVVWRREKANV